MFVCYLDDSDDDQSSVATLAGYCASLDNWSAYEDHASEIYKKFGVEIMSAKEMHNGRGAFKGWSWAKKWTFVDELFEGAAITWGVAHSVYKPDFNRNKPHSAIGPNMSKLGLAMAGTMHSLLRGNPLSGHIQTQKLSFVVESGHKNNGDVERYYHFAKSQPLYDGFCGGLTFADKRDAKSLHLADLLAFYSRRQHSRSMAFKSIISPEGKELKKLHSKLPHIAKIMSGNIQKAEPEEGDANWWSVPLSTKPNS